MENRASYKEDAASMRQTRAREIFPNMGKWAIVARLIKTAKFGALIVALILFEAY